MSETVATPPPASPLTPTKEDEIKKAATASNGSNAKKFEGDGLPFKSKLIGMEDLSIDRDEKICLDSMFKLKAVVRARGEHKQRIQLNLTMTAVKVFDDTTKALIASHEIERISFVVIDPRDTRAFGYIYNTSDDRHQFWAIKTERAAAATILALKELFELAFEQYTSGAAPKDESSKPTVIPVSPAVQEQSQPAPVSSTLLSDVAPIVPHAPSLLDDGIWGENPTPVVPQKPDAPNILDWNEPVVPPTAPPSKPLDPLEDIFGGMSLTTPTVPPPASTGTANLLFEAFSNPVPPPTNPYGNFYAPPSQPTFLNTNPTFLPQPQRPATPSTMPLMPLIPQQQQTPQNSLSPTTLSPVAPPSVTSPFADIDFFGGISSGIPTKPTKESFFPGSTTTKTIQQLQMEKQRNPFYRP